MFYVVLLKNILLMKQVNLQENLNRTKTDSGN